MVFVLLKARNHVLGMHDQTGIEIFKSFNLKIRSGQTLGVVGKVGSGKTSLVDLISRIYDPKKGDIFIATGAVRDDGTSKQYIPIEFPAIADFKLVTSLIKASKELNIESKVGICQSKDSFFGEVEPERMPVAPFLDNKWQAWQKGGVGASEMEAATLFTVAQIRKLKAGAVLAVEVSDEETIKKMTKIVLECINIMEKDGANE